MAGTDDLPFVGAECPQCGYFCRDEERYAEHVCFVSQDEIAQRKKQFLSRWGWKFQKEPMARELDELIEIARRANG